MAQRFDGNRCSNEWGYILRAAREIGKVGFRLNDGNRTLAEQRYLYNHQPPLAAFPSPWAPHIRVGRADHALDVDQFVGDGTQGFVRWVKRELGLNMAWTVRGEGWHVEAVSRAEFKRAAAKAKAMLAKKDKPPDPLRVLGPINRRRADRLLWHRREARASKDGSKNEREHYKHADSYKGALEAEIRKLRRRKTHTKGRGKRQYDVLHRVVNDRDGRL